MVVTQDKVQARPWLAATLGALSDPVLFVDGQGRIALANAAALDLFGQAVAGLPVLALLRQPAAATAVERALNALENIDAAQGPFEARLESLGAGGETTYSLKAQVMQPETGLTGILVSLRDISHIEDAEQQRRDFIANVSHELRSPLTALVGFIETLQGPARDDPEARENFLRIMEREAGRMTRLVGDLLHLSKVESNERIRPRDRVNLTEVVRATLAALRPQIEEAGLQVSFNDPTEAVLIPGDRDQLVQVCMNLVENAIKYGRSGKRLDIEITSQLHLPALSGPGLSLTVTDHGEGIDALHIPRLTERFYRVDSHRSREAGGTGLGLAIVKHIVNRHRGRLIIRSTKGEGSRFTVLLPCS